MKPRNLPLNHPILALAEEIMHTRALLLAYPYLTGHATAFEPLYARWQQLLAVEMNFMRERVQSEARAIAVDDALDILCSAISGTLLVECNNDRKAPEYLRYFGNKPPSQLKRPVLGQQLDVMHTWVPSLTAADSSPALKEYGRELADRVVEADAAEAALSESRRKRKDHEIGMRQDFVNELNAARVELYGQLAKIPLTEPARKLPTDFAHKFFLRTKNRRTPTIADMEQRILRGRERLEKDEAILARLLEEEEARRRLVDDAELRAAQQAVLDAENTHAEAEARLAEILARGAEDVAAEESEAESES